MKHVCGRCPPETGYPGKPFDTYEELVQHFYEAHHRFPIETVPPPQTVEFPVQGTTP